VLYNKTLIDERLLITDSFWGEGGARAKKSLVRQIVSFDFGGTPCLVELSMAFR